MLNQPTAFYGMNIFEIREIAPPDFQPAHHFATDGSSIVIRQKRADGSRAYLLWDDPATDESLTQSFRRKLATAGFTDEEIATARVQFDRTYVNARTRKITIKGTHHRGSECPVVVEGTPDVQYFAWTVGIGELTGSGFGALR